MRRLLRWLGLGALLIPNDQKPLHPGLTRSDYGLDP